MIISRLSSRSSTRYSFRDPFCGCLVSTLISRLDFDAQFKTRLDAHFAARLDAHLATRLDVISRLNFDAHVAAQLDAHFARRRFALRCSFRSPKIRATLLISLAEDSRDATHTRSTRIAARLVAHFAARLDAHFAARLDAHLVEQA
jgi:hypothetical protein